MSNETKVEVPAKRKWYMKEKDNWKYKGWAYDEENMDDMIERCEDVNYLADMLRLLNTFQMAIQKPRFSVSEKSDTQPICYHKNFFAAAWTCHNCINFGDCQANFQKRKDEK